MPVLTRRAEQRADDRRGISASDVADHITVPDTGQRIDQLGDDVDDQGAQSFGPAGRERLGHEPAQPVMRIAVEADDVLGGTLPQRPRGDALQVQAEPMGGDESRVA